MLDADDEELIIDEEIEGEQNSHDLLDDENSAHENQLVDPLFSNTISSPVSTSMVFFASLSFALLFNWFLIFLQKHEIQNVILQKPHPKRFRVVYFICILNVH